MKIPFLKLLVTSAACYLLLTACQQPAAMQGGIVDNGNKPGDSTGPAIPLPPQEDPSGEVNENARTIAQPIYILGGRHEITSLPSRFSLRHVSNDMTHILDTPHNEAAAKLALDGQTRCETEKRLILTTIDGGQLSTCSESYYELKASNGDRIIVTKGTLSIDALHSILQSIKSQKS
jgi:hypothetical protein